MRFCFISSILIHRVHSHIQIRVNSFPWTKQKRWHQHRTGCSTTVMITKIIIALLIIQLQSYTYFTPESKIHTKLQSLKLWIKVGYHYLILRANLRQCWYSAEMDSRWMFFKDRKYSSYWKCRWQAPTCFFPLKTLKWLTFILWRLILTLTKTATCLTLTHDITHTKYLVKNKINP